MLAMVRREKEGAKKKDNDSPCCDLSSIHFTRSSVSVERGEKAKRSKIFQLLITGLWSALAQPTHPMYSNLKLYAYT